ncbi:Protein CBG25605 [Caenorhabditis briggsae]|uniref:Uncharacterized protein n=2 Tax=Caenorhabditis briggsae TaxID=6238 RepID=A0AAE9EBB7_CAEBR|nr:Protein CBG25605 [Caenorhabditis briggsae]UMM18294.1 hypothetical protein L5515_014424 [Caenorhabditis briggsae]CAR98569.1 Protein CBG25605 [Caenorhabditis briggsae]
MNTSFESEKRGIQSEIQKLECYERNCLQGLLNCDRTFQQVAPQLSPAEYERYAQQTQKVAEAATYSFMFVKSVKDDKMVELQQLEQKKAEQQFWARMASQEEK